MKTASAPQLLWPHAFPTRFAHPSRSFRSSLARQSVGLRTQCPDASRRARERENDANDEGMNERTKGSLPERNGTGCG
ncbi:hypothetical protein ACFFQF_06560 [Haladaptatus pallidirubidus]|uniref:hypothetical protein n=1 Tax=Haladaptatus pallidirubidus TaxID=1008152 RepID=UPI001D1165A4|nr:hypothetical protein [Haladaptatus pallidirubidus]